MKKILITILALVSAMVFADTQHVLPVVDVEKDVSEIVLNDTNFISLNSEVSEESIAPIRTKIASIPKGKPFYIFIDSPGGEIISGLSLVDILHSTDKDVVCVARFAASMAFSIFQACPTRVVMPSAIIMQHRASGGVQGNTDMIEARLKFLKGLEDLLNKYDSKRLGKSIKDFKELVKTEWWLVGSDIILSEKAADEVNTVKCSPELAKKKIKQTILMFGIIPQEIETSACPL
jgi:ATP-dependent Clp protease protease subunit